MAFSTGHEAHAAVERILAFDPQITRLSMVFTGRAREFYRWAEGCEPLATPAT